MFSLTSRGWQYFDPDENRWINTVNHTFNENLVAMAKKNSFFSKPHADDLLPAFSGTKILCVGKNYRKHAAEMGGEVPSRPLWFYKPPSAIIGENGVVRLPKNVGRIDYEGELILVISKKCRNVSVKEAAEYIGGVTAGFDMTARDLQKTDGQWTRAKGFDTFLPLASLVAPYCEEWKRAPLEVRLNNSVVQSSSVEAMVFGFNELISDISSCMTLEPGDLIMTGTPEGVGPVKSGDKILCSITGPCKISVEVTCE
ncbi:MAG: hypothetical protein Kow0029_27430 [Candidatus Rifleibacteriota bacterium]